MTQLLLSDHETITNPATGVVEVVRKSVESKYDWVGAELLQGGTKGLVLSSKCNYNTAFVEAFIAGSFIRGEGETLEAAETDCWNKYQKVAACVNHEYEPRGYHNGGGICKNCGKFASKVFTGAQLGQFCVVCGEGTLYKHDSKKDEWYCENDDPFKKERAEYFELLRVNYWNLPPEELAAYQARMDKVEENFDPMVD